MLRRLSRFLTGFGFSVETVTNGNRARALHAANHPDFLIVDGDGTLFQECRSCLSNRQHYTYTFLIAGNVGAERLTEALEGGVDDFLAKPLVFGELLARLHAGARVLEYERRMREQSAIDPATGLLSRCAFRERLTRELENSGSHGLACVLLALDYFDTLSQLHGPAAGILRSVADQLRARADECRCVASFGSGQFAALLPHSSDAAALAWVEELRGEISELVVPPEGGGDPLTASAGVAICSPDVRAADVLLHRAEDALRIAQASGHDCVVRGDQLDGDTRDWEELARKGRLFATTVARDVMIACHLVLHDDHDAQRAAQLLERLRLAEVPVVDRRGKFLGLFCADPSATEDGSTSPGGKVADVLVKEVKTVPEDESFDSLMRFFMAEGLSNHVAVVVRRDKPLGMVYRSGLAALSLPLTNSSFAPDKPCSTSSDFLRVPAVCPAD